ncbi:TIGR02221 family CRISPR-associated protein [Anaerocellum danielii]|uniref:TIGR02221 family CRISPR-associated protein n=1 Tax=Anaerocellum danielii TaxID=1387557 RepID=A0ABZ0U0E1_9FIRM|nr:TIGR02221 family CRISPR-associated protein [Caldicellulosiruptor danielii]WPX08776.1 TIGR02221 family CRISPR-associated protein [Caldicellulosiruptor danielii]
MLKEKGIIKFDIEAVTIPRGFNDSEIWQIFDIVTSHIDESDQILFDITHGYRYLPMLEIVMLNFLKTVKNIEILGIYYSIFETKEVKKPILNLTPFIDLLDLSIGINAFLTF